MSPGREDSDKYKRWSDDIVPPTAEKVKADANFAIHQKKMEAERLKNLRKREVELAVDDLREDNLRKLREQKKK